MRRFIKFLWEDTLAFFLTGAFLILAIWALVLWSGVAQAAENEETCRIQARLAEMGYYRGEVDCDYGAGTKSAIRAFQRDKGLFIDGVVGEDTYKAIMGRFRNERAEDDAADPDVERPVIEGEGGDYAFEGRKCKNKVIKARGSARPWVSWARSTARKNWNQAARFEYGELYADWENAEKVGGGNGQQGIVCTRASVGGVDTYRCQFSGKACQAGS